MACCTKNFGTGADCSLGAVEIDPSGRIAIHGDGVEMGNGIGTAMANRVAAYLGGMADEVAVAQLDVFGALGLVTSGDPYAMTQPDQDAAARNPRWVPAISSATAASTGAHVGTHAAAEAARIVFRFGLWPAALDLWRIKPTDPQATQWEAARWQDGRLVMPGQAPLPLADIAARAHARNGVTGAMAHAFSRWAWSHATFAVDGQPWTSEIDALAVRSGSGKYTRLDRTSVQFPPTDNNRFGATYTTFCGTAVRSRSSARPARCASPRHTASSIAARRWSRTWCSGRRKAPSRWGSGMRSWKICRRSRPAPATGNGTSATTSSRVARICRCTISRSS